MQEEVRNGIEEAHEGVLDRAPQSGTKRTKTVPEEGGREQTVTAERGWTKSSSGSTGMEVSGWEEESRGGTLGGSRARARNAVVCRRRGGKAEDSEEDEEARRRKTEKFLKKLQQEEKESTVSEIAEVEVNKQEVEMEEDHQVEDPTKSWTQWYWREGDKRNMDQMVETLKMFDCGSWQEATTRARKVPTTSMWVDRVKKDEEGQEFVRCRFVARDLMPRHEGSRDDLYAAMFLVEGKKASSAYVLGTGRGSGKRGEPEVKRMFVDVKKVHINARCGEDEEVWVELQEAFSRYGKMRQIEEAAVRREKGGGGVEDDCARKLSASPAVRSVPWCPGRQTDSRCEGKRIGRQSLGISTRHWTSSGL